MAISSFFYKNGKKVKQGRYRERQINSRNNKLKISDSKEEAKDKKIKEKNNYHKSK